MFYNMEALFLAATMKQKYRYRMMLDECEGLLLNHTKPGNQDMTAEVADPKNIEHKIMNGKMKFDLN